MSQIEIVKTQDTEIGEQQKQEIINLIISNNFTCGNSLPKEALIATFEGKVIGYLGYNYTYGANAYVFVFVVTYIIRNLGVGSALIKALVEQCQKNNIKRIEAIVDYDSKKAIDMYEKLNVSLKPVLYIEANVDDLSLMLKQNS